MEQLGQDTSYLDENISTGLRVRTVGNGALKHSFIKIGRRISLHNTKFVLLSTHKLAHYNATSLHHRSFAFIKCTTTRTDCLLNRSTGIHSSLQQNRWNTEQSSILQEYAMKCETVLNYMSSICTHACQIHKWEGKRLTSKYNPPSGAFTKLLRSSFTSVASVLMAYMAHVKYYQPSDQL